MKLKVEEFNVPLKTKRLKQWCEDLNRIQSEIKYDVIYVEEENYHKYYPKSFQELIDAFKETSEDLIKRGVINQVNKDKEQSKLL